ncbi:hypothetical protein [Alkalibacillus aidingensis]|uniref:hypothetical protein n=1 Tax=Alkalibacillus aidingensis TaxID=2747607 RepID=UPI00166180DA|nr:hypothetical protein [Alkalibacillus aidingensis]
MAKCQKCNDTKKIKVIDRHSEEWEKAWDHYDNMGIYDMNTCNHLADSESSYWEDCPVCKLA